MSDERQFCPGDRVRTIYSVGNIGPGTRGTVVQAFLFAPLYDVRFDGHATTHIVVHHKLVPDLPVPVSLSDGP